MTLVSFLLIPVVFVAASGIGSGFPERQHIILDQSIGHNNTPVIITLDGSALNAWNTQRKGMRILSLPINSTGGEKLQEVPFEAISVQRIPRREQISTQEVGTAFRHDGYHMIIKTQSSGTLHNEAEIVFPTGADVLHEIAIDISHDGTLWEEVGRDYVFRTVDVTGFTAQEKTRISYPERGEQFVRFRVLGAEQRDILPRGVQISRFNRAFYERHEQAVSFDVRHDDEHNMTRLLVYVGNDGHTVDTVTLSVEDTNFNRRVVILSGESEESAQHVATERMFSIDTPKFRGEHLSLSIPDSTAPFIQVNIFHEDDNPIEISGITVSGPQQQLAFLASPEYEYGLYIGNSETTIPKYDLGHLIQYVDFDTAVSAHLSAVQPNPQYAEPEEPALPLHERMPWLLPSVLAVLVVFLGILGLATLRKTRHSSQDTE
jgi:hypothetical protein